MLSMTVRTPVGIVYDSPVGVVDDMAAPRCFSNVIEEKLKVSGTFKLKRGYHIMTKKLKSR
jgi:hypothetical protein